MLIQMVSNSKNCGKNRPTPVDNLRLGINALRLKNVLCDVTIIVDGKHFEVHKLVLAATSPYFKAIFTSNMKESNENTVTLHGSNKEAVEIITNFLYTGQLNIDDSNVQCLLAEASLFQMAELQNKCCDYLKQQLDAANCLGIRHIAQRYEFNDLVESATAYTLGWFEEVIKNEEFLGMAVDDLIAIISAEELNVTCEETLYEAVMGWITHQNSEDRVGQLANVMEHVRFSQMESRYLARVSENPLIKADKKCRDYEDEAKDYYLGSPVDRESMSKNERFKQRKRRNNSRDKLYVVGGWLDDGGATPSVERYDPMRDEWTEVAQMNKPRRGHGLAVLNNILYAFGGRDKDHNYSRTVECYHVASNRWTIADVAQLPQARSDSGIASLNGCLYVTGGKIDGGNFIDPVDRYDPVANK